MYVVSGRSLKELDRVDTARVNQSGGGIGATEFDAIPNVVEGTNLSLITYGFTGPLLARASQPGKSRRFMVGDSVPVEVVPIGGERNMLTVKPKVALAHDVYLLSVDGCLENRWNGRCYFAFSVP